MPLPFPPVAGGPSDFVLLGWQLPESGWLDAPTGSLLGGTLLLLAGASGIASLLKRRPRPGVDQAVVRAFGSRVFAWWMMTALLAIGFLADALLNYLTAVRCATVVLFGLLSFQALREFVTITPTRPGDHRALFWTFFAFLPLQYVLIGLGSDFYPFYSIMIPVYASLFVPTRIAISGDPKRFLERSAKIQAGLLICVYSLSHAPALLTLRLRTWNVEANAWEPWQGSHAGLLFFFILMVQASETLQYAWSKLLGRHVVAPAINGSRTWEGVLGGSLCAMAFGGLLWWVTPFTIWGACLMSLQISLMCFAGGMTMSAIKRDRGVQDYGTLVQGHVGVLDRIDSACFAAPVFFHVTRFFLESPK